MSRADAAAELQKLAKEVESCTRCDLHCNTHKAVPGEGPADARIMFVGEGPGRNEDLQGRPFVGAAGKFLAELLAAASLKREEVYITNVVKHRPTQEEPDGSFKNRAPRPDEVAACRVYLDRQIELIQPRIIVTLGAYSLAAFFPDQKVTAVHGKIRERDGRHYFHSYHPAAALYTQQLRDTMLDDMKKLGKFIRDQGEDAARKPNQAVETKHDKDGEDAEQLRLF
jgi:uracil-DNA glycosylase